MNISKLAREHGIKPLTLHGRLRAGWSLEKALSVPVKPPLPRGGKGLPGRMVKVKKLLCKMCSRCRVTKPLAAFTDRSASLDGLEPHCRECKPAYKGTRGYAPCPHCATPTFWSRHFCPGCGVITAQGKKSGLL